jgi:sarcosine oxidase
MRVVVVGLGAMGVAATRVLAERGHDVLAFERHGIAHSLGSSAHGARIFRFAYPDATYVRLARRSLHLWRELERRDGSTLLTATGLLEIGGPHDAVLEAMADEHAVVREVDAAEAWRLAPGVAVPEGRPLRWSATAGTLAARDCLLVQADAASRAGAEIAAGEPVAEVARTGAGVRIETTRRTVLADVVVVTAGPWTNTLLGPIGLALPLEPQLGQASVYRGAAASQLPCVIEWAEDGSYLGFGLPVAGGYKLGIGPGAPFDPADDGRRVDHGQVLAASEHVRERYPVLEPFPLRSERCPWTMTPDGDFVLDRRGPVVIGAGCSGHAFKFSPVLGELLADLVEGERAEPRFAIDRPAISTAAPS